MFAGCPASPEGGACSKQACWCCAHTHMPYKRSFHLYRHAPRRCRAPALAGAERQRPGGLSGSATSIRPRAVERAQELFIFKHPRKRVPAGGRGSELRDLGASESAGLGSLGPKCLKNCSITIIVLSRECMRALLAVGAGGGGPPDWARASTNSDCLQCPLACGPAGHTQLMSARPVPPAGPGRVQQYWQQQQRCTRQSTLPPGWLQRQAAVQEPCQRLCF